MSGSDWGRHSKSCCKIPLGNMAEYCLTNIAQACNFLYHNRCVNMWFVIYYQAFEQKKCWENVVFTIHVLSRLTVLLTWAASKPRLDVCCDLLQHLQGAIDFTLIIICTYIDFARPISHQKIAFHTKCNQIQFSYHTDGIFCSIFVLLYYV